MKWLLRRPAVTNTVVSGAPTNRDQEDADLQQALAASAAESGVPPQESGLVDDNPNPKYFGPANRTDYDADQWAMVPTQPATTSTTRTGPAPSARKRDSGAPVLLRHSRESRLGPLVTILHEIPLVRNILLSYGLPSRSYGHNSEWWAGKPILTAEELAAINTGDIWADSPRPDFGEELHRLMAFLEQTNRSYGMVDGLAESKAMNPEYTWVNDWELLLFQALKDIPQSNPSYDISPLLLRGRVLPVSSNASEGPSDAQPFEEDAADNAMDFAFLDVSLDVDAYYWVNTLYDALDHLMWSDALSANSTYPEDAKMAVLEKPSEVITIRLGGTGLLKPCSIPAVFFPDRYLMSLKDTALHSQNQMREIRIGLQKLANWEQHLIQNDGKLGNGKIKWRDVVHDVRDSYRRMIEAVEGLLQQQTHDAQFRRAEDLWKSGHPYSMDDIRIIHTWTGPYELTPEEEAKRKQYDHIIQVAKDRIEKVNQDLAGTSKHWHESIWLLTFLQAFKNKEMSW